jgi:hypothetical protein
VLDIRDVVINGGAIRGVDDDGIQVVGYFGDASGGGLSSSGDAVRALRVAVGLDAGFDRYRLADPRLIADISGDGRVGAIDATQILREVVGIDQSAIPPLPASPPPIVPTGPDPLLSLPRTLQARRGGLVTVPVNLDVSDGLESADLALSYDTRRLELVEVTRGDLTGDFDLLLTNVNRGAGTIRVGLGRTAGAIQGRGSGSVVLLKFRVRADAPAGRAVINLRRGLGTTTTQLNDGDLDLHPDPSNTWGDALDGIVTIRTPASQATAVQWLDAFFAGLQTDRENDRRRLRHRFTEQ